ncbi:flagellar basal body protein [Ramlibacter sp. USB13]|uniref:Flagellar basal body protein n=1 Tax=Ramlibacter cellulosilyticus TaxID=2764187 RepID=A0A923SCL9_9BURK|nr:flagellar basal body protein [Ramlibacter cellulosilyticus]MBC5785095.1 flagellar basal body protein [Ramlibacter cellulosilyticus]
MPAPIESMTTAALSAALDAATRTHALVSANVANAGTERYQLLRSSFHAHLEEARAALADRTFLDARGLASLRGAAAAAPEALEGPVQVDAEMTELARNAVQFQVLVQGLSRHLSMLALAAGDGRK